MSSLGILALIGSRALLAPPPLSKLQPVTRSKAAPARIPNSLAISVTLGWEKTSATSTLLSSHGRCVLAVLGVVSGAFTCSNALSRQLKLMESAPSPLATATPRLGRRAIPSAELEAKGSVSGASSAIQEVPWRSTCPFPLIRFVGGSSVSIY